jgi:glycosyltransferase involved in cell wall biosynthesis
VLTSEKRDFDHPLDLQLPELDGVVVKELIYSALPGARRGRALPGFVVNFLKWVRRKADRRLGIVLDPRDGWAKQGLAEAESLAEGADVVVSTFGPRAAHEIAAHLKARDPNLFWVADYRDLWSQNFLRNWSWRARHKERRRELACVASADLVTTVSDELAASLDGLLGRGVHVVSNGFDEAADARLQPASDSRFARSGPLVIAYTGIVHEPWQDPAPLFKAIALLRDEGALQAGDLLVEFYGGRSNTVVAKASKAGVQDFVRCLGHVTRDAALSRQQSAGALLLLENGAPEARGILTGKVFEYLAARVPIVSVGGMPTSAAGRTLSYCCSGISAGVEPERIAVVLRELLSGHHPPWFAPQEGRIMEFSRQYQACKMLDLIVKAVRGRHGR